jgi:hypothetical protein
MDGVGGRSQYELTDVVGHEGMHAQWAFQYYTPQVGVGSRWDRFAPNLYDFFTVQTTCIT